MVGALHLTAMAETTEALVCRGDWAAAEPLLDVLAPAVAPVRKAGAAVVNDLLHPLAAFSKAILRWTTPAARDRYPGAFVLCAPDNLSPRFQGGKPYDGIAFATSTRVSTAYSLMCFCRWAFSCWVKAASSWSCSLFKRLSRRPWLSMSPEPL
ncbi:hypothetical protein FBY36_0807 [Arthrobacter sp. SLBN-122]|nr:hypothetical protein FBY36_0807 [Arthrobacter sp. SLBN-122]